MAEQFEEKTHDPTPHRRQQAREQGQIAQSRDLDSAMLLLVGLCGLLWLGGPLVQFFGGYTQQQLGTVGELAIEPATIVSQWNTTWLQLIRLVFPLLSLLFVAAIGVKLAQVGFLWLPNKLALDITKLNPLEGIRRMFSLANAVQLAFGLLKIAIVSVVAWVTLRGDFDSILGSTHMAPLQIVLLLFELVVWTSLKIAAALVILALLDYGFQRWRQERDLRMSHDEIREEMKHLQGDPQVIARRRQVQRQLILNRLSSAVPKADVVVTNPTELAIAIQYDPQSMAAPVVVAKGAGALAQRIRKLALENGIPIVERKPLAQLLYKRVELNRPIPSELYAGVAEVLAYVYQLTGKKVPEQALRRTA